MNVQGITVQPDRRFVERGEEFSAGHRRAQHEAFLVEGTDYSLPRKHQIEDSVDWQEVPRASMSTPIPASNKGYMLLQKMGWQGSGLGPKGDGRPEPIDTNAVDSGVRLGLGRMEQEMTLLQAEVSTRRQLAVEEQLGETADQEAERLQKAQAAQKRKEDVRQMNRDFYCEICDKQYSSVAEMEEHLCSYDHHHRKRLKEMKQINLERNREKRDRKEQKRLLKEQQKLEQQIAAVHQRKGAAPPGNSSQISDRQTPARAGPSEPPGLPLHKAALVGAAPLPPPPADAGWQPPLPPPDDEQPSARGGGWWANQAGSSRRQPWQPSQPDTASVPAAPDRSSGHFSRAASESWNPPLPPGPPPEPSEHHQGWDRSVSQHERARVGQGAASVGFGAVSPSLSQQTRPGATAGRSSVLAFGLQGGVRAATGPQSGGRGKVAAMFGQDSDDED